MYTIKVHKQIEKIISAFYFIGLWNGDDRTEFRKWLSKTWYLVTYGYFAVSLFAGAFIISIENEDPLFLGVLSLVAFVLEVRLYYFLWKKDEILELLRKLGTHSLTDNGDFNKVNNKIGIFIKFVSYYGVMLLSGIIVKTILALPILSNEKHLPLSIYFNLYWNKNELVYWTALAFVMYEMMMTWLCTLFNVIIWYLMMACAIKYQILGNEFRNIGMITTLNKTSITQKKDLFVKELIALTKNHKNLQRATEQLRSCFSNLFFLQIATSSLGICGSIYILAFTSVQNPFQYGIYVAFLFYNFFDIFVVTYFGNDIKFLSSRLSYSLFECNWMDQSESCKKYIFIIMEVLKRPQELLIGKLYPLDLEIFTNILRFSYSMFNLLQNFK